MKKLLFTMLVTFLSGSYLSAADFSNADDLCYDKNQIYTEGAGCVDFGPFSGGFACKKTIPIRNQSTDTLSDVSILWHIGDGFKADFVESCGIDGKNEEGKACKFNALINIGPFQGFEESITFDPMPDFTGSGDSSEHSIYLFNLMKGSVDPFVFFRDGALHANYTKNGDTYTGTINQCVRNWGAVEHLCYDYDAITYDSAIGGICMDFGPFKGGFACRQTIPIRSLTDQSITDIDIVLDEHGMNGNMLDDCGIDGHSKKLSGECQDRTLFNFGPMGMMARGFSFDMPDYDTPFDKHSIFTRSLMNMSMDPVSFFTGENMYTYYTINGTKYDGYIPACTVNKDPVPDLCYEYRNIDYSQAYPPLGGCVELGPFKGGAGCKQLIPIRNTSSSNLTSVDILLDTFGMNGNFLGDCGVDDHSGYSLTNPTCKEMEAFDFGPMGMFNRGVIFDPMANYAPFDVHSIYTSAAMSMGGDIRAFFLGENLYTHYVKDGTLISGKIAPCKENFADDLCIEEIDKDITFDFWGGFFVWKNTVKVKNQRNNLVTHVSAAVENVSFLSGKCELDNNGRNRYCADQAAIDFIMGWGGSGTAYYENPYFDFEPNDRHRLKQNVDLLSGIFFDVAHVYANFVKNDEFFSTELENCLAPTKLNVITGTFDAWDDYRIGIYGDRHISTKIVNKPFTLYIASLNADKTAFQTKNVSTNIAYGLVQHRGTDFVVEGGSFNPRSVTVTTHEFTVPSAYRDLQVGFKLCSEMQSGDLILHENEDCSGSTILACDDGRSGTHWRMCTNDDRFAVRPDRFDFKLPFPTNKDTLRSGETYKYQITAKDFLNHPAAGYDQEGSNLDDSNASILLSDGSPDEENLLHGTIEYDGSSYNFVNGVSTEGSETYVAKIDFDDVGLLSLFLKDSEWAAVDSDDTPAGCEGGMMNGVDVPDGLSVCGLTRPTFIPHHFALESVTLHNHKDGSFTYLGKDEDPADPNNDITMSAHIGMKIVAENKDDNATENFRTGSKYYENPVSVGFALKSPVVVDGKTMVLYQHDMDEVRAGVTPTKLGFGTSGVDNAGEYTIAWTGGPTAQKLNFNFEKDLSAPQQPFTVDMTDLNVTVTSRYGGVLIQGLSSDDPGELSGSATFQYAKVSASRLFYDDVTTSSVETPVTALVYCAEPLTFSECTAQNIDTTNGMTPDRNWWLSTTHDQTKGDGDIRLKVIGTSNGTADITPKDVIITSGGIQHNVNVTHKSGTLPQTVDIGLDSTGTSAWMMTTDTKTHSVRFTGKSGWVGHGPTGYVIDSNASSKKSNRVSW